MESFHAKNVKEHQSLDKPLISKAIKKKKKNVKRKTTLEHSKVIEEICLKNNKIDNLAKCELRCNLCFKEHFPQSKFCRWSEEKKNSKKLSVKTKSTNLSEDTINLVKKKIQYLQDGRETRKDVQMKKINDAFLKRSQNASDPLNYPDLLGRKVYKFSPSKSKESYNLEDTSNLKLRGGVGENVKVKKYVSNTKDINLVLNSLRSSSMLASLTLHNKCPAKNFCKFCLLRSTIIKINLQKGKNLLITDLLS